jgi:hypothetical protein
VFDLLFLIAVLASCATLLTAAFWFARGRGKRAFAIVRNWAICAAIYVAAGVAVSFSQPQRIRNIGEPWCFDDWCLKVERVSQKAGPAQATYAVELNVFSRAARVSQRASGAWIYVIDDSGRRYPPLADASDVPLDVLLQPGESVHTSRAFQLPADVNHLGLITGHGGSYCGAMAFLIIGQSGCLFHRPAMIRIR